MQLPYSSCATYNKPNAAINYFLLEKSCTLYSVHDVEHVQFVLYEYNNPRKGHMMLT